MSHMTALNNELTALQRELAKKNAKLARLNEEKNQLLGMVAHDLRNPLTAIDGLAQLLLMGRSGTIDATAQHTVERIAATASHMVGLVADLVDLAAVEAGSVSLQEQDVEVATVVRDAVDLVGIAAAAKDIELRGDVPADMIVRGDRGKLRQVVENIVGNAVKYSHADTTVTVVAEATPDDVVLTISDEGQGIPADELSQLFRPFGTTSVTATGGERSTGLGLAIVHRLVEAHGGTIEVTSEVGVGTAFVVRLPRQGPAARSS